MLAHRSCSKPSALQGPQSPHEPRSQSSGHLMSPLQLCSCRVNELIGQTDGGSRLWVLLSMFFRRSLKPSAPQLREQADQSDQAQAACLHGGGWQYRIRISRTLPWQRLAASLLTTCRREIRVPVPQVNVQAPHGPHGLNWHGPNCVGADLGVGTCGASPTPKLSGFVAFVRLVR